MNPLEQYKKPLFENETEFYLCWQCGKTVIGTVCPKHHVHFFHGPVIVNSNFCNSSHRFEKNIRKSDEPRRL